jgi:Flp pilus assembly pilin Flp
MPLAVVGTLAGHSVGYRAAVPDAQERAHLLASTGHNYLEYAPLVVALCLALVALGFVATVLAALRGRDTAGGTRQIKLVAALVPVAFVLQEVIERYAHDGRLHWELAVSAPFLLGLATQLPFALLAAAIAFALATAAERVAQAIKTARRPRVRPTGTSLVSRLSVDLPPEPVLARGYTGRGPPLLA